MSHLDVGILHALLDGEIPSTELGPIQEHLAACAECRARLQEERQLLAESDSLVGVIEVPAGGSVRVTRTTPSRQRLGRSLAWAATVIAAVGVGYVARGAERPAPTQEIAATLPGATDSSSTVATPPSVESVGFRSATEGSGRRESAPVPSGSDRQARSNVASDLAQQRKAAASPAEAGPQVAAPPPQAAVSPPPAAPAPAPTLAESQSFAKAATGSAAANAGAQRALGRLRDEPARADQLQAAAEAVLARPEPITFPDAVRRLAGSLRLIEGLVPLRLEAQGLFVRVVYATAQGELALSQQLVDGRVEYRLLAPAGFPADSLARLRAQVRE